MPRYGVVDPETRPGTASAHDSSNSQLLEERTSARTGERSCPPKGTPGERGERELSTRKRESERELYSWRERRERRERALLESIIFEKQTRLEEKEVRVEELTIDMARTVAKPFCTIG